jgi:hypothetical protein
MRAAVLWALLAIGNGAFIAMLVALWRRPARVRTPARSKIVSENVWAMVPWLVAVSCAAPAVHRALATNQTTLVASAVSEPPPTALPITGL